MKYQAHILPCKVLTNIHSFIQYVKHKQIKRQIKTVELRYIDSQI